MKKYIFAMAIARRKALDRLYYTSEELAMHILKCIVYKDVRPDDMQHWLYNEISNWLSVASDTCLKCSCKLKKNDLEDNLFGDFGEDENDIRLALDYFKMKYCSRQINPYPDFEITPQLVKHTNKIVRELIDVCIDTILRANRPISKHTWYSLVEPIITQ